MTATADIERVLAEHPDLGRFGFQTEPLTPNADFVDQVHAALTWIKTTPSAAKLVTRRGSYGLKHAAERQTRRYVGNAAMIAAAALAGFRPLRSTSGPNCRFACA